MRTNLKDSRRLLVGISRSPRFRTREEKAGIRGAGVVHLVQKPLELWREVHGPMPSGFGVASGSDSHLLIPKVYFLPPHFQSLLFTGAGKKEKSDIESQLLRILARRL